MWCYKVVMWDSSGKGMGTSFDMIISLLVMANILVMGMYSWKRLRAGYVMELEADCSTKKDAPDCEIVDWQVSFTIFIL